MMTMEGEHHRKQRKMLGPIFSIAHMREMGMCIWFLIINVTSCTSSLVPTFYGVAHKVWRRIAAAHFLIFDIILDL